MRAWRFKRIQIRQASQRTMRESNDQTERFCRACRQSLRGIASARCPECRKAFDPNDPRTTSPHQHGEFADFIGSLSRTLIVCTGLATALAFVASAMAYPIIDFPGPFALWFCGFLLVPVSLFLFVVVLVPSVPLTRRMRVLGLVLPILFTSIALTNWPLCGTFLLHRPWLEKVADQVQASGTVNRPGRVGVFGYRQARLIAEGNVGFQLTGGSGGGIYLVRRAPAATRIWYNTNWEVSLVDSWYLVYED